MRPLPRQFAAAQRQPVPDVEMMPAAPPAETTDAELVRAALDGDGDAFDGLVGRYHRRAFWVAYHVVGRVEDARDVVQDAFVRLHRSLHRYDFGRSFYTWFYRIVMNLAIDALRKRRGYPSGGIDDYVDRLPTPHEGASEIAERGELRAVVWAALDRLDAKFKSVLVLRDIHGLSCREIAPILGVTHATVRWRLHRGRQMFRQCWERMSPDRELP